MNTDDLIAALSRETPAVPPRLVEKRLGLAALIALLGSSVVVLFAFGPRMDLASVPTWALLKASFGAAMALAVAPLALKAARPAGRLDRAAWPFVGLVVACLLAAAVFVALAPEGERVASVVRGFPPCLKQVPITAIPAAIVVFLAFRSLSPTRLVYAGAAAGAVSGGLAVVAYALHCPIDRPGYVLVWYPLAVTICAAVGALIGPRVLRW